MTSAVRRPRSVRLDNVARIIERVLTTIDNNPDIVKHLTQPVGEAAEEVGAGAGQAVGELETGAGSAVEDVGQAVDDVGEKAPPQRASEGEQAQQPTERTSGGVGAEGRPILPTAGPRRAHVLRVLPDLGTADGAPQSTRGGHRDRRKCRRRGAAL
jgi:hypothetical protein